MFIGDLRLNKRNMQENNATVLGVPFKATPTRSATSTGGVEAARDGQRTDTGRSDDADADADDRSTAAETANGEDEMQEDETADSSESMNVQQPNDDATNAVNVRESAGGGTTVGGQQPDDDGARTTGRQEAAIGRTAEDGNTSDNSSASGLTADERYMKRNNRIALRTVKANPRHIRYVTFMCRTLLVCIVKCCLRAVC